MRLFRGTQRRIGMGLRGLGLVRAGGGSGPAHTYATWNPADKSSTIVLSNGDLTATTSVSQRGVRGTISKNAGKWYFELTVTVADNVFAVISQSSGNVDNLTGGPFAYGYYSANGEKRTNGTYEAYGNSYGNGSVISVAVDMDARKLFFGKNGTWQNSGDPAAGTGFAYSSLGDNFFPALTVGTPGIVTANFGATAFAHTVPTGFNSGWYTPAP